MLDGRIPWLDGLRALSILLVISRHVFDRPFAHFMSYRFSPHPLADYVVAVFASLGWIGVHIFFVISGFLIGGGAFLAAMEGRFSWRAFLAKRLIRVFVPAVVFLVFYYAYTGRLSQPAQVWLVNMWFITNYTGDHLLPHYWSLCVELHFYLAVIVVAVFARRYHDLPTALGAWLVGSALAFSFAKILAGMLLKQNMYIESHWQIDFFIAGAGFRFLYEHYRRVLHVRQLPLAVVAIVLYIATSVFVAAPSGYFDNQSSQVRLAISLIASLLIAGLLFTALVFGRAVLNRIFESAPMRMLGAISYSIYLVHVVLIIEFSFDLPATMAPAMAYFILLIWLTGVSIIGGSVFYILIERPLFLARDMISRSAPTKQQVSP